jgi:hypothetical protein
MVDDQAEVFGTKQKGDNPKTEINFQLNQLKFLKGKLNRINVQLNTIDNNLNRNPSNTNYKKEIQEIKKALRKAKDGFEKKFPFAHKKCIKFLELNQDKLKKQMCWLYQDKEEQVLVAMVKNQPYIYIYKMESDQWVSINLGKDPKMEITENTTFCYIGNNQLFCMTNNSSLTSFIINLKTKGYKINPKTIMNNMYTACIKFKNNVFVVGALKNCESRTLKENVECLDLKTMKWRLRSNLIFKRKKPELRIVDSDALIMMGGSFSFNSILPVPEIYSHSENSWSLLYMNVFLSKDNVIISEKHDGKILILGKRYVNNIELSQHEEDVQIEFDCDSRTFTRKDLKQSHCDSDNFFCHTGSNVFQFDSNGVLSLMDNQFLNAQSKTTNSSITMTKKNLIKVVKVDKMFSPKKMEIQLDSIDKPNNLEVMDHHFSFDEMSPLRSKINIPGKKDFIKESNGARVRSNLLLIVWLNY